MRATEFITEKKHKKQKTKHAAYGPGPYGWYGFDSGYSGDGGGIEESQHDQSAEKYREHLIKTLPQIMKFFDQAVKGWKPSEEQMMAAIETAYTVMKHTGDIKQAGRAMMDELNTLHRMSQGQQGVAESGNKKEAVRRIQKMLNKKFNANLDIDGILGPLTLQSINKFMPSAKVGLADEPNKTTSVQGKTIKKKDIEENFADGRNPQDKGDAKRHGINTKASVSSLRKTAKQGGRKGQLAHWLANMKAGRAKAK
jgi:hypothetical protein